MKPRQLLSASVLLALPVVVDAQIGDLPTPRGRSVGRDLLTPPNAHAHNVTPEIHDGRHVWIQVSELGDGVDYNQDGDQGDTVIATLDLRTARTTVSSLAGVVITASLGHGLVEVSEQQQGSVDLNGDGDTDDEVWFVHRMRGNASVNLGICGDLVRLEGSVALLAASEVQQGADLDANGVIAGHVLHTVDLRAPGSLTNWGLAGGPHPLPEAGDPIVWIDHEGNTDRNGDGDTVDGVFRAYDFAAGTSDWLAWAARDNALPRNDIARIDGGINYFAVRESAQGSTDLNGDGDANDLVLFAYGHNPTATVENLGLALGLGVSAWRRRFTSGLFFFSVQESAQGTDLSGDGDTLDHVLHAHEFATGTLINTRHRAASSLAHAGLVETFTVGQDHIWVSARESDELVDYNGDGDTTDGVTLFRRLSAGVTTVLDDGFGFAAEGDTVLYIRREFVNGVDLNGDADSNDSVLFALDVPSGQITVLGVEPGVLGGARDGVFAFEVIETDTDLDGDGLLGGRVLHIYDTRPNALGLPPLRNLGIAAYNLGSNSALASGGRLAFVRREFEIGDLNGDGDVGDYVVHTYGADTNRMRNTRLTSLTGGLTAHRDSFGFYDRELTASVDTNQDGDLDDWIWRLLRIDH